MANLGLYIRTYYRKIWKKIFGVVHLKTSKNKRGTILLSFLTGPFTLAPHERFTDPHPNYWTCEEIARIFLDKGYDVDVIEWNDSTFKPKKRYAACVDLQQNLERLSPLLNKECIKVGHLVSSYPGFQNTAEKARLDALEQRRGVKLSQKRPEAPSQNARYADFLEGYGNKTVHATFAHFGKPITQIHVATKDTYEFPHAKDLLKARDHFLWFGGGGAILKGLDLVIEAFAPLSHLQLTIIGPAAYEKEFEQTYEKELQLPHIKRYPRPRITDNGKVEVAGKDFKEYLDSCAATVFMSASEGAAASVVQTMQAGLVPIVTPNSGIDERSGAIFVTDPTVENIRNAVLEFSKSPPEKIQELSKRAWSFAREHHTREAFTKNYIAFVDNILKL